MRGPRLGLLPSRHDKGRADFLSHQITPIGTYHNALSPKLKKFPSPPPSSPLFLPSPTLLPSLTLEAHLPAHRGDEGEDAELSPAIALIVDEIGVLPIEDIVDPDGELMAHLTSVPEEGIAEVKAHICG